MSSCMIASLCISLVFAAFAQRLGCHNHGQPFFLADITAALCSYFLFTTLILCIPLPFVAALLSCTVFALLACFNWAKQKALRDEPLTFADVALVHQVFAYPHLYLPFLPLRSIILGSFLFFPCCILLGYLSPIERLPFFFYSPHLLLLFLFLFAKSVFIRSHLQKMHEKKWILLAKEDCMRIGPLCSAAIHAFWSKSMDGISGICGDPNHPFAPIACKESVLFEMRKCKNLPDIFVIQEESFCDPRPFLSQNACAQLGSAFLENFDTMAKEGVSLPFCVSAYGAYTMRTEYEVLSGIYPDFLGTDRFHPYRRISKRASWSYAWFLQSLGYRTICIHPYARGFFFRDKALPNLGFQKFIALEDFLKNTPSYCGPYIADTSLARTILSLLGDEPTFFFVITMENHGPWLANRLEKPFVRGSFSDEIAFFCTHIHNADTMLGLLRNTLKKRKRKSLLALYGDHLPGIPSLIPKQAQNTPCLLWGDSFDIQKNSLYPAELLGTLFSTIVQDKEPS